jgi:hypothetical protein
VVRQALLIAAAQKEAEAAADASDDAQQRERGCQAAVERNRLSSPSKTRQVKRWVT